MKNKITFLYGLGERKEYKNLFKYFNIPKIDWNKCTITPPVRKVETLVGFSLGSILACMHAEKSKVNKLIFCSLTPMENLNGVKTDEIVFMVGSKEKFCLQNIRRIYKKLKCKKSIIIIPGADHKIVGNYKKKLLEVVKNFR